MKDLSKSITATINHEHGLHARPVTQFIYLANIFHRTDFIISVGERSINAKSLLGVLSLGICKGTTIQLTATGPSDEVESALSAFEELFNSNFAESTFNKLSATNEARA